jgi:hypothetical protein
VSLKAWAPLLVVCAIAVARALTASAPELPPESDEGLRKKIFDAVASDETSMRREGAKSFPTDAWSRDDDFHRRENKKAREWAGNHHVRLVDAFEALDQGLRERWPQGNPGPLVTTTPPCRPRAIY